QHIVACPTGRHPTAVTGRERELVVPVLAEEVVEPTGSTVEGVVASASVDLVVAAARLNAVVAARSEDLVVLLGTGDDVVAVRTGDDEGRVVEVVGRQVVLTVELDGEVIRADQTVVIGVRDQERVAVALQVAELGESVSPTGERSSDLGKATDLADP